MNRFVLDGMTNDLVPKLNDLVPKLEVRFRRSRQRLVPDGGSAPDGGGVESDSLGFCGLDRVPFYTIVWTDKYYKPKARAEYFRKQQSKKGALIYTRTTAKKDLRAHGNKSISAQLRKLMEAKAKEQQRRRQAQLTTRRAAQAARH